MLIIYFQYVLPQIFCYFSSYQTTCEGHIAYRGYTIHTYLDVVYRRKTVVHSEREHSHPPKADRKASRLWTRGRMSRDWRSASWAFHFQVPRLQHELSKTTTIEFSRRRNRQFKSFLVTALLAIIHKNYYTPILRNLVYFHCKNIFVCSNNTKKIFLRHTNLLLRCGIIF